MPSSRRSEALTLAEELLGDIEYSRLPPSDIAKKASRLARLLDDEEAMAWLRYEVAGYTPTTQGFMTDSELVAAQRSRRLSSAKDADPRYDIQSLGQLETSVEAAKASLAALTGSPASGEMALRVEDSRRDQRYAIWTRLVELRRRIDGVLGAIHEYAAARYQELRFGDTVESAFDRIRARVDADIAALVPGALPRLSAAFENTSSTSPEHWANAASTCRRLLKEVADVLRPAGPDVDGRKMGDENYINRLIDWLVSQSMSDTTRDTLTSELQYLGHRLDAIADAGHKGAHADVSQLDASRFLVGTYILLGDILRFAPAPPSEQQVGHGLGSDPGALELDNGPPT